jgi:hypothetical protein
MCMFGCAENKSGSDTSSTEPNHSHRTLQVRSLQVRRVAGGHSRKFALLRPFQGRIRGGRAGAKRAGT